ncbi:hypothetical protein HNQ92_003414 [Rhabdobacter roseus]|uniref:Uncharacterized protein n=1 Tax=Rhabdobacter roseus TaxID=1655419 RepID=A0A840TUA7_9BACT|nr:hypothetical protein [Rhabdobacter roseus]MBB5285257.1 hypothetical protein [Rhabdobacter roseus]
MKQYKIRTDRCTQSHNHFTTLQSPTTQHPTDQSSAQSTFSSRKTNQWGTLLRLMNELTLHV